MSVTSPEPSCGSISFRIKDKVLPMAHKVPCDLPPSLPWPHLPLSFCSNHTGLPTDPLTRRAPFCPTAFALAVLLPEALPT